MLRLTPFHLRLVSRVTQSAVYQQQQQRFMMYNPNQRKPSNKKKKRKLKRKAMKTRHREALANQKREQGPKIDQLVLYSLPYPLKLQKVVEHVDNWYDRLHVEFTFCDLLLENDGWFPVSFVQKRLGRWTNHGIIINAFLQVPDLYNVQRIDSLAMFPPVPETFAQEAEHWRDYEYEAVDFHEDEWFDLQTDLDDIRKRLETEDDSKEYDAMIQRKDFTCERIQQIDDEVTSNCEEERKQYPKHFGDENERNPAFGYDDTVAVTSSSHDANALSDLSTILSRRKH